MTRENLHVFWELIDEVLNSILFLLVGLEILLIHISARELVIGLLAIPLVLLVRFVSVGVPMGLFKRKRKYNPHTIGILTWGGLRGGLALALSLAIPPGPVRAIILPMTYAVVVFSIIVQGMTIKHLVSLSKS